MHRLVLAAALLGLMTVVAPASASAATPSPTSPTVSPTAIASPAATVSPAVSASPWLDMGTPSPEESMPVTGGADVPILPYLIQLLVVTAVVGGLGYYSLRFVQNKVPGLKITHGKQINVIDRVALDPKRMMFVVNVGGRYWLLAATEDNVTTVAELSKDDLGGDFAQLLEQEKHRGETL